MRAALVILLTAACVGARGANDTCEDCIARNGTYCLGTGACSMNASCTRPYCGVTAQYSWLCPKTEDCYALRNCTSCLAGGCNWCQTEQRCVTQSLEAFTYCDPRNSTGCNNYCTLSPGDQCPSPTPCHERHSCLDCTESGQHSYCQWGLEQQRCFPSAPGIDLVCGKGSEDACLAKYKYHCPTQPCDGATTCRECTDRHCVWCGGSKTCVPQGAFAPCRNNHTCLAPLVRDPGSDLCPDVDCNHHNCRDCLGANCHWCGGDASCRPKYGAFCADGQCPVYERPMCPPADGCAAQTSCSECSDSDSCGWCPHSQRCVPAYFRDAASLCTPNGTAGCAADDLVTLTHGLCPIDADPPSDRPWGIVAVALGTVLLVVIMGLWQWRRKQMPQAASGQPHTPYRII